MTYTELRNFLDGYTNDEGEIQGDPAIIAAEAVAYGIVTPDEDFVRTWMNEVSVPESN